MTKTLVVSYAHEDAASAATLAEELRARGVLTWQDVHDIRAGNKIESEIAAGIESNDGVLSLLTPAALASAPIRKLEIDPVLERRRRGEGKALIVVARNLGDRADVATRTVETFGEDLTLDWMPPLSEGETQVTAAEAVTVARAVLKSLYPRNADHAAGTWRIGLHSRAFTPGPRVLELDWTPLVGVDRRPGTPADWARLWTAMRDVKRTLAEHSARRDIVVDGQAHLTAGLLFGLAFSRTSGFRLTVLSGDERWPQASSTEAVVVPFNITESPQNLKASNMIVEIEVSRQISGAVSEYIMRAGQAPRVRLLGCPATAGDRWLAPSNAGPLAARIGREIRDVVDRTRVGRVDLFYAGPLVLAILLGAELGSLEADLQLFEYHEGVYAPSLLVPRSER